MKMCWWTRASRDLKNLNPKPTCNPKADARVLRAHTKKLYLKVFADLRARHGKYRIAILHPTPKIIHPVPRPYNLHP